MKRFMNKKTALIFASSLLMFSLSSCAPNPLFTNFFDGGGTSGGGIETGDRYSFSITEQVSFSSYYNTGNYGSCYMSYDETNVKDSTDTTSNTTTFEYYRALRNNSGIITLMQTASYEFTALTPNSGSFYTITPIINIKQISITYDTDSDMGTIKPYVTYGEHNYTDNKIEFDFSETEKKVELKNFTGKLNFFKINAGSCVLNIKKIDIIRLNSSTGSSDYSLINANAHEGKKRTAPHFYSGTLVDGVTTVEAYVDYEHNVKKSYTYYSTEYAIANYDIREAATLTDPIDVANYYSIFGVAPANYGPNLSSMRTYFGTNARQSTFYNRTGGYATAIPNVNASSGYYELDIALDSGYQTNRGPGRIVAWRYGINNASYGNGSQIVCHFTDDHYATFQEYNNLGQFLPRFNAEQRTACAVWSLAQTIEVTY